MPSFFDDSSPCDVVPLITCSNGSYVVDPQTLAWLAEKKKSFGVVACAGRYRTGKSFLLNRLARADSGTGFGVGDTVQACTKGLWIYKKWFATDDPNKDILFMDTEGIDALDADDTHDVRVFTLALLLSTVFLYNSIGPIDETSMQTLSLMTRVTENVKLQSQSENADLGEVAKHMPAFFWILRDFSFALVDRESNPLSPDAYLEYALQTGDSNKDQVRAAIRGAFDKRRLVTLPRPGSDATTDLEHRLHSISSRFVKAVDELRASIFASARPFVARAGQPVTGSMYGALCTHLASMVERGSVPVIHDSWTLMAAVHARDLKDDCLHAFDQKLREQRPLRPSLIEATLEAHVTETLTDYDRRVLASSDPVVRAALERELRDRATNALPRLTRDRTDEARQLLKELPAVVAAAPREANGRIEEMARVFFGDEPRDVDAELVWFAEVGRALLRAVPALARANEEALDQVHRVAETAKLERDALETQLRIVQDIPDVASVRERELAQLLEAREMECAKASARGERVQQDLLVLRAECCADDMLLFATRAEAAPACEHDDARLEDERRCLSEQDDALHATQLRVTELETELRAEQQLLQDKTRKEVDLAEKLARSSQLHAELEASWNRGLEELKAGERARRAAAEERVRRSEEKQTVVQEKCAAAEADLELQRRQTDELAKQISALRETHEKERAQLLETAQRHREQCETAQQRVLEIHQSMLEDSRLRDEKSRELQSMHLNDRVDLHAQLTELKHANARAAETLDTTKKRVKELEPTERELKRLKTIQQSDNIVLVRLQTEVEQLHRVHAKLNDERDALRQENMRMEGELVLLRAEKQLHDARISLCAEP